MKNPEILGRLDPRLIEGLLASRPRYDEDECEYSDLIASFVRGAASTDEKVSARSHLASCAECRTAVEWLHRLESKYTGPSGPSTAAQKRPLEMSLKFAAIAAAAALIHALGFVLYRGTTSPPSVEESLHVKGEGDAVFMAVKRGPAEFSMRPLDKLENGDSVGFFYSAEKDGFTALFNLDNGGTLTRLFPSAGETSAPVREAERAPLPDGASVGNGFGCEWVVAVFSDTPLDLAKIEKALQQAPRENGTGTCEYAPKVQGARSVVVLPFRR